MPADGVTVRCDSCIDAILALNRPRVTRQMLEEPYVPDRLSERLASDLDAGVALAASELLARSAVSAAAAAARDEANEPTIETPPVSPFADSTGEPSAPGLELAGPDHVEHEQDIDDYMWADKW
ncbi:MAG: hypothetical protein ACYCR4_07395 [Acidimicrobiales bacterium]